ncbi:PREDICTED: endoribonuclease Dicer homolog 2 isoform X2 [Tarenaya hassleriana]|uniref:endoribonuclease Dicer homolog 2 isoform X2 n=1 Tax=Tarenaya hassleriana TaxID=28532 RepID=UPI00053C515A|nr:PREDICTED: endoribonuclease Dicer homolog 2 isoform X2 [Tarenaya hassleriana]
MDAVGMEIQSSDQLSACALPFARSYQVEALEKAIKQNTIVFLETGSGKTLIAIMLLRSYAHLFRKPSPHFAVFLVPQVVLVTQQAEALRLHTDLQVGMYWGDMGVDFWDASTWKQEVDKYEDFYHEELKSGTLSIPRIFGMTASPVKTKGAKLESYWKNILELETLMNSKVYTCVSESVLAGFIPFSTPKFKFYQQLEIPCLVRASLEEELVRLKRKHRLFVSSLDLEPSIAGSIETKMSKICSNLLYCLDELGIWLALKATKSLSANLNEFFPWGQLDTSSKALIQNFCLDASKAFSAYIPSDPLWSISDNINASLDEGLLTSKTVCLVESLLEYSALKNIRCIIFVERVLVATVLGSLLAEIFPKYNNWKTKYMAGSNSGLQYQTRKKQNEIVEDFRKGLVNIIVATSILEEGLDVQSCNLVVRFDPSATVCSFIQSRGRARMQNSDYLMLVKSGDLSTHSRLMNYLSSGNIMRRESLLHASVPCQPLPDDTCEEFYRVAGTGASVTLSSSVNLIYFYCSRLPSDGYFKPAPRFDVDRDGTCIIHLPKSCPLKAVTVHGHGNMLKKAACLEACKQLHKVGALTDNLVPDMVVEETVTQELCSYPYSDEQPCYFPPELIGHFLVESKTTYHFYLIGLKPWYPDDFHVQDILLGTRAELEDDIGTTSFKLGVKGGAITVTLKYIGVFHLTQEEVFLCRRFQITLLRTLLDHNPETLTEALDGLQCRNGPTLDFLLLPANHGHQTSHINWNVIKSVNFSLHRAEESHFSSCACGATRILHAKDGLVCVCAVQNALVYTPHTGKVYCITGVLENLNANSLLSLRNGSRQTYREYYQTRHGIKLGFVDEPLLRGRHIFTVHNYFNRGRKRKEKDPDQDFVELPPELCGVILSPVSVDTIYTFSFVPSIMYRLESLLIAYNLKKMHLEHSTREVNVPTIKILEAITTKKCQDQFHLESLETLGDSFLKYAVSQHLFNVYQNHHEGLLSSKRERITKNAMLCKLGCEQKLQGFIRNECFEPKTWMVPGQAYTLTEDSLSDSRNIYVVRKRNVKRKSVADAVEALIGAYLCEGGEVQAVMFMDWVGINVNFANVPYQRELLPSAEKLLNVFYIESLLNYKFQDRSLLVEALTHGSYMLPEIPRCYQRLEFLGDSVLDYVITKYLYDKYPFLSPGLLTDMRSASVNNDHYARAAMKAKLHKHILHASHDLHKHMTRTVDEFEHLPSDSTFGWEAETSFPKVLGDVIESLAGAILVDSGYNTEAVFASIQPLLGCMVTPETLKIHPVRELTELCQKEHFEIKKEKGFKNGKAYFTVEVKANRETFVHTSKAPHKDTAKRLAYLEVLKSLKDTAFGIGS